MTHLCFGPVSRLLAPSRFVLALHWLRRLLMALCAAGLAAFPATAAPGDWDARFDPDFQGAVQALGLQADGKIIVSPRDIGAPPLLLRRLLPGGEEDASFQPEVDHRGVGSGLRIDSILEQPDGKLLISGAFPYGTGNESKGLTRLLSDGRADASFQLAADSSRLRLLGFQRDGKILVYAQVPNPELRWGYEYKLSRLLPSGEVDASFQPLWQGWRLAEMGQVVLSQSGHILVVGLFENENTEIPWRRLARLESSGAMDTSFNPVVRDESAGDPPLEIRALAEQADGKILVGGHSVLPDDYPLRNLVRLQADGAEDDTFHAATIGDIHSIQVQADGRILAHDGQLGVPVVRLLANGARDAEFNAPSMNFEFGQNPEMLAVQQDGALLINGALRVGEPRPDAFGRLLNSAAISRLSISGGSTVRWERGGSAPEVSWVVFETQTAGSAEWVSVGEGTRVPGGWELAGATLPARGSVRARGFSGQGASGPSMAYLALGGAAPALEAEHLAGIPLPSGSGIVDAGETWMHHTRAVPVVLRNAGDADLRGVTFSVAGPHAGDFRIVPMPETLLAPGASGIFQVHFQPSAEGPRTASLAISGADVTGGPLVFTLNGRAGARLSPVFASPAHIPAVAADFSVAGRSLGPVTLLFEPKPGLFLVVAQELPEGTAELADLPQAAVVEARFGNQIFLFQADYNRDFTRDLILHFIAPGRLDVSRKPMTNGHVSVVAGQADGGLLFGGEFTAVDGQPRTHLARLFANGVLDPSFAPVLGRPVEKLAVQADGKILVVGRLHPMPLVRLLPDGSPDASFSPSELPGQVSCVLVQPDGKILVGGTSWVDGAGERGVVIRLLANGAQDADFSTVTFVQAGNDGVKAEVMALGLRDNGQILVGGMFSSANGVNRTGLVRLHPDGAVDEGFDAASAFSREYGNVRDFAFLPDGRIWAVGRMEAVNGDSTALLSADGLRDPAYRATAYAIDGNGRRLLLQADGKALLGGSFSQLIIPGWTEWSYGVIGYGSVVRLLADGSPDPGFRLSPQTSEGGTNDFFVQPDGWIYTMSNRYPENLVRLYNDPVASVLERPAPTSLLWRRNGAQMECGRVEFSAFDSATGTWSPLGNGTRTAGGWELSGVALPAQGTVRACGFLGHGPQGITEEWLALGGAAPALAMESSTGEALPSGSGTAIFPEAPMWQGAKLLKLRLRNAGSGVMEPPVLALSGPQAGAFKVLNPPSAIIGPQQVLELVLAFHPSASGLHTAQLSASFPGQAGGPYTIALQGQGVDTLSPHFASPSSVAATQDEFFLEGVKFGTVSLGFAPAPGTRLKVLERLDGQPLGATFIDLPHESEIAATYEGRTYLFRANYVDTSRLYLSLVGPGTPEVGYAPLQQGFNSMGWPYGLSISLDQQLLLVAHANQSSNNSSGSGVVEPGGIFQPFSMNVYPRTMDGRFAHAMEDGGWWYGTAKALTGSALGVARLEAGGVYNSAHTKTTLSSYASCSAMQADGKLLLGGTFSVVKSGVRPSHFIRLNADGSLDDTFSFGKLASSTEGVRAILLLPDGKILIGGNFTKVGSASRANIARLLPDGSLDESFAVSVTGVVTVLALQADGKILLGGSVSSVNGATRFKLARLLEDGVTLDASFVPVLGTEITVLHSLALQADGKLLVCGAHIFSSIYREVVRLFPDGSLDPTFVVQTTSISTPLATPSAMMLQGDGRLLASGEFLRVNGFNRRYLARLLNDPATETLSVPAAGTVRWMRGGSAPETHDVWFDVSADAGATWTRLGAGSRIAGGWELGGLNMPASGHVRARARVVGGYHNASSSLVESVAVFGREATALEQWRAAHFGSPFNQGAGRDDADADFDGLPNLMEYALGLDPHADNTAHAPRWTAHDGFWELRVTPSPVAPGVVCSAEWSLDLQEDSWQPAEDAGDATGHLFRVPAPSQAAPPARYVRWRVRQSPQP